MSASIRLLVAIVAAASATGALLAVRETEDLRTLIDRQGNFQVLMPANPTKSIRTLETKAGRIRETSYVARMIVGGTAYGVSYADFPEPAPNIEEADDLLDRGRDACIAAVEGKLLDEVRFRFEGAAARDFSYLSARDARQNQIVAHVRLVFIGTRLYQLTIVGDSRTPPTEEAVGRFFGSFELLQL